MSHLLDYCIPVDIGNKTEAKPVGRAWVHEAIDCQAVLGSLKYLSDAVIHLVVDDGAPIGRFAVGHGLVVYR